MQIKKIMAVMLAAMTLVSTCTTAFAADQVFTEDGTANVPVTCEIESSYKVKLPAIVALAKDTAEGAEKNSYKMDYTVGVAGNIDSDKFVNVEPDTTDFVLKDASGKRPVTPELTAEKVAWSAEDLDKAEDDTFVDSTSAVSAVIPKAGKYSGTIVYNFALSETEAENTHKQTPKEPEGYTLTWAEPLSEYGSYLGNTTEGSESNKGSKAIVYTDVSGKTAYADPYQAGSITIKPGSAVTLRMIAGKGSYSYAYWYISKVVNQQRGYNYSLINSSYTPSNSGAFSINRDEYDDHNDGYSWRVKLS